MISPETGSGGGGGGGAPAGDAGGGAQRDGGSDAGAGGAGGAGGAAAAPAVADDTKAVDKTSAATTIAGGASEPKAAATAESESPTDDWRKQFAGEDKAQLKQLERFASSKAVWDAYRALQGKVSAGELKAVKEPPSADAKPEEIAAWRKDQGLPETPEAYAKDLKLADGLVLPDADKPFVESFAEAAHEVGVPQAAFNRMVGWFYDTLDAQGAAREQADADFHVQSLAELRQEWGNQITANQRAIGNLLEMLPGGMSEEGIGHQLLVARLPDGSLVGDNPQVLRGLVAWARELFPAATLVPAGTTNPGAFIGNRMAELEKMMGDPRSAYNYGAQKQSLQQEYRDLVDAQIKMKGKAA